jgi:hypothetical protein
MSNANSTKQPERNSGAREPEAVPASYKTPVVLLIYTVKSCKGIETPIYQSPEVTLVNYLFFSGISVPIIVWWM